MESIHAKANKRRRQLLNKVAQLAGWKNGAAMVNAIRHGVIPCPAPPCPTCSTQLDIDGDCLQCLTLKSVQNAGIFMIKCSVCQTPLHAEIVDGWAMASPCPACRLKSVTYGDYLNSLHGDQ